MGFQFQSEQERNPTPPSHEQLQAEKAKQKEMICADIQAQLDEINEFIDENRLLAKFYTWQELRRQLEGTSAEVISDDEAKLLEQ